MAAIPGLTDDFTGAAAGVALSTSNTVFDAFTGAGTSVFDAETFESNPSALFTVVSNFRNARLDITAGQIDAGWFGFAFKFIVSAGASPFGANCAICGLYGTGNTVHAADIRINTDGSIRLRNAASSDAWIGPVLTNGNWYYVALRPTPNNYKIKVYQSGTVLAQSTDGAGAMTTPFNVTGVDTIRFGPQTNTSGQIKFARLRGDTSTEIVPPAPAPAAVASYTQSGSRTINATGSTGTTTLVHVSGPSVVITESPTGVYKVDYDVPLISDIVLDLTATSGATTDVKTIVITQAKPRPYKVSMGAGDWN